MAVSVNWGAMGIGAVILALIVMAVMGILKF